MGAGDIFTIASAIDTNWLWRSLTEHTWSFIGLCTLVLGLGFAIGMAVQYFRLKDKLKSNNRADEIFSERIAKNRINALDSVQSVLDEMISFEDIELLLKDKSLMDGCPHVRTTIAMLHGFSGADKYFVQLAKCLSSYSKYLPNNLRARLINISHLQRELLEFLSHYSINEEEKDYLFALATYPIAEDLKRYVREAQGIIADCLNTTNIVSEAQTGEEWERLFNENKKRTNSMFEVVKDWMIDTRASIPNKCSEGMKQG